MEVTPLIKQGKIRFNENLSNEYKEELINELKNATITGLKSKHDDILDTISMLILVDLVFPVIGNYEFNTIDYMNNIEHNTIEENSLFNDININEYRSDNGYI